MGCAGRSPIGASCADEFSCLIVLPYRNTPLRPKFVASNAVLASGCGFRESQIDPINSAGHGVRPGNECPISNRYFNLLGGRTRSSYRSVPPGGTGKTNEADVWQSPRSGRPDPGPFRFHCSCRSNDRRRRIGAIECGEWPMPASLPRKLAFELERRERHARNEDVRRSDKQLGVAFPNN